MVDGKIQAFPWNHWRAEFSLAQSINISLMEWTLDHERFDENPIMTSSGRTEIRDLAKKHGLQIKSLTGDCFMQAPFWKAGWAVRKSLERYLDRVIAACAALDILIIVVPLVDNGSIQSSAQEEVLVQAFNSRTQKLKETGVMVAFESDQHPVELRRLINLFDSACFGINYDIGNSAAAGFDPSDEWTLYGDRIVNVHIKDRPRGGTTVPLGEGDADFKLVFRKLREHRYNGNFILQTARALDGHHLLTIDRYRSMVESWLNESAKTSGAA